MKNKPRSSVAEDSEEMIAWRTMSQEEMDECWKKPAGKIEEVVLDQYKVEDSKRGTYRGRCSPLEWRRVGRSRKYKIQRWGEDCWARIFSWFREYDLQRLQRMNITKDMAKKITAKGRMDANSSGWVSELLAADCEKAWLQTGWEHTMQKRYDWLREMKKKR